MKAMIFAAGLGTRLKPLTDRMPKALVPVCGKPLLQWQLERMRAAGIRDVVVNVHHFAQQIVDYVQGDAHVAISDETDLLRETGGAVRHALPLLRGEDYVLIHNVDILSNVDLPAFMAVGQGRDALLLVSERQTQRYLLFDDDLRLVGWTNVKTGEVKSPHADLDVAKCRKLAFAGIHLIGGALMNAMETWPERFSIIDFYLQQCAHRDIYGYVQPDLQLMDVGKLDTLHEAEAFQRQLCK